MFDLKLIGFCCYNRKRFWQTDASAKTTVNQTAKR